MAKGNKKLLILLAIVILWFWYTNNSKPDATTGYRRSPMMRSRYAPAAAVTTQGPLSPAAAVTTQGPLSPAVTSAGDAEITTALNLLASMNAGTNTWDENIIENIRQKLGQIPADYGNDTNGASNLQALYDAWAALIQGTEQMTYDVNSALGISQRIGTDNVNIQALKNNLNAARSAIIADMANQGMRVVSPNDNKTATILDNLVQYGGPAGGGSSPYRRRSRYVGMPTSSAAAYGLSGERMGMSGYSSNMLSGANPFIPKSSTGANTRKGSLYDIRAQPNVIASGDPLRGYLTNVNPFKQGV
jgi:hypothetical protein